MQMNDLPMGVCENIARGTPRAYFVGIAGVGMSAIARILKRRGSEVSGSDRQVNSHTAALQREGIAVYAQPNFQEISNADFIVYSSAISAQHIERVYAKEHGIPVYHRAQVLASLINQAETSVGISGTHGKTTTSSMIAFVLAELGRHPTCLIGGDVRNWGTNALLGDSGYWVAEIDESDKTQKYYAPNYTVLTNLERDHV